MFLTVIAGLPDNLGFITTRLARYMEQFKREKFRLKLRTKRNLMQHYLVFQTM